MNPFKFKKHPFKYIEFAIIHRIENLWIWNEKRKGNKIP